MQRQFSGERTIFSTNGAEITENPHAEGKKNEKNFDTHTPYQKINSKQTTDLKLQDNIINF